jgi:hypothetical protein
MTEPLHSLSPLFGSSKAVSLKACDGFSGLRSLYASC